MKQLNKYKYSLLFLIVAVYLTLHYYTLLVIPTIDTTGDDTWIFDQSLAYYEDNYVHQTTQGFDLINNEQQKHFRFIEVISTYFFDFFGQSIKTMRILPLIVSLIFLCVFAWYCFILWGKWSITSLLLISSFALNVKFIHTAHNIRYEIYIAFGVFLVFIATYKICTQTSANIKLLAFFCSFASFLMFFQIHPNGILIFAIFFLSTLFFFWKKLRQFYSLIPFVAMGIICAFIFDTMLAAAAYTIRPDKQSVSGLPWSVTRRIVPAISVFDFTSIETTLRSFYHFFGLLLSSPTRFLSRIDTTTLQGVSVLIFIILGAIISLIMISIKSLRTKSNSLLVMWFFCVILFPIIFNFSSTDYSFYAVSISLLIIGNFYSFIGERWSNNKLLIFFPFLIPLTQVSILILNIYQVTYQHNYENNYDTIINFTQKHITDSSKVLGGPIYFCILKERKKNIKYTEIYAATGIDWTVRMRDPNHSYKFLELLDQTKFDYVIIDEFFIKTIKSVGYSSLKEFELRFLSDFLLINSLEISYPSKGYPLKNIILYQRKPLYQH